MKLFVQDCTRDDLKRYATEELMKDAQFMEWHRREDTNREIIEEIVRKADGVFLWVYLVVRSLRSGIVDGNSISELRRRLDALPPTLEQYFRAIFDRIEDFYQEETGRIFLVAVHAAQPLSVLTFSFLRGEQIDPDYALNASVCPISDSAIAVKVKEMPSYLNARCKDLLEVNKATSDSTLLRYRVDFLHRTVRDFLKTNDMHQMLSRRAKAEFDPRLSLCRMFLAQIKVLSFPDGVQKYLNGLFAQIDEMMHYAQEVEAAYRASHSPETIPSTPLLDELDRVVTEHSKVHTEVHWTNLRDVPRGPFEEYGQKTFLAAAIQSRLRTYVGTKLKQHPNCCIRNVDAHC
ncbi:hypothetical protein BDV97DRAFT_137122 [Delphinella strobiligena]|nr:hypothetical protein BDV97DRAFT_137122 [Delphinella strobiligena]